MTRGIALVSGVIALCLMAAVGRADEPVCPAVPPIHVDLPMTRAAIAHDRPVTVVALGSSSTEGAGATAPDRAYPAQLQSLLRASWPDAAVTVLNQGVGGQTIDTVLPRLSAVFAVRPTLVIWQVGTNEALRAMDAARYAALLDEGVRRLTARGIDVILMDAQRAPKMPPGDMSEIYQTIVAAEARANGVALFSRDDLMRSWDTEGAKDMIGADGLHHTDRGYRCLAVALDAAIVSGSAPRVTTVSLKPR